MESDPSIETIESGSDAAISEENIKPAGMQNESRKVLTLNRKPKKMPRNALRMMREREKRLSKNIKYEMEF